MNAIARSIPAVAVLLLLVAGCSGPAASNTAGSRPAGTPASGFAGPGAAPGSVKSTAGVPAGPAAAVPAPAPPPGDLALPEGNRVQRSARLTLEVGDGSFDRKLDEVLALATSQGGYVSGSNAAAPEGGRLRTGQITFQVPSARFDDTLAALRRMGRAEAIGISGNDVSQQYVDLQARLRNAEAQRDAMLALLGQAKSVNEILQVQNQLGQVTGQIEQLKGQIAFLDHTTTFATLAVTIREGAAIARPADEWGFRSALQQALHSFVNTINAVVVGLGALGPVLIAGLLAALLFRRFRPRSRAAAESS